MLALNEPALILLKGMSSWNCLVYPSLMSDRTFNSFHPISITRTLLAISVGFLLLTDHERPTLRSHANCTGPVGLLRVDRSKNKLWYRPYSRHAIYVKYTCKWRGLYIFSKAKEGLLRECFPDVGEILPYRPGFCEMFSTTCRGWKFANYSEEINQSLPVVLIG